MTRKSRASEHPNRELTADEYAVLSSCPNFEYCGEQDCPLDALNDIRVIGPGKSECTARKSTRLKLGSSLPRKGLTRREFAHTMRFHGSWEAYLGHQKNNASSKGAVS
jgi:hypothetical protein